MSSSAEGIRSRVANFAARVGDDRRPAEELDAPAERLGGVHGAVDEDARRRPVPLREDLRAVLERQQGVPASPDQLVELPDRLVEAARRRARPTRARAPSRPTPPPSTAVKRMPRSSDSRSARAARPASLDPLDEHVDLAAAGQADAERELVVDAVGQRASARPSRRPPARSRRRRSRRSLRETEPHIFPDDEIARLAPSGRGAERRVATTVATTTCSPSSIQRSTSGRISFTPRASFRCRRARPPAPRDS